MDRQQIRNDLAELVAVVNEEMAGKVEGLSDDSDLRDGLGLDSLQMTELIFEIEEKFNTKISDDEAGQLRTVGELLTLIETKVNAS